MKKRLPRVFLSLTLIFSLCFCLVGCNRQNYRKAIALYNEGQYDAAATLFSQLDGYENSGELQTLSRYWEALTLMGDGEYSQALPRFLKLGDYEDSAARAIECKYQMAITAFETEDYTTAETYFLEAPQYRQASEYLRQITWLKFYEAVVNAGAETDAGITLQKELDNQLLQVIAAKPEMLIFAVSSSENHDFRISDSFSLTLERASLEAAFSATGSFAMNFIEGEIGSEQAVSGHVNIATCMPGMSLTPESFQITVTDNLGDTYTSTDPADCLMEDAMVANLSTLLTEIPLLLTESGIEWTLTDIGFSPNT